ncbi:hypothetical protein FOL47_003222, partial [Perkinsus chesapeaki]
MEELDVIRRSTSAWRFPCVFVPKKNGKVRMNIDYRSLKACHTVAYPVPRRDDVQEHLAGAQITARGEDQRKTAFCPGPGFPLYERVMMPFCLASAPDTFQRLMERFLGHILIVFELLRAAAMTVAAEKCEFMEDRIALIPLEQSDYTNQCRIDSVLIPQKVLIAPPDRQSLPV